MSRAKVGLHKRRIVADVISISSRICIFLAPAMSILGDVGPFQHRFRSCVG
ncbi:hypothetical protein ES703_41516 [subsurface metagenome]